VTAVWMRFRSEVRSRWRSWLVVAVLAGVAGGLVLTAAAGARRTHSALARHLVAFRFPDAWIMAPNVDQDNKTAHRPIIRRVRSIRYVEASAVTGVLSYCARDAQDRAVGLLGPEAVQFLVNLDGRDGVTLHRPKLLAGRTPDQRRPREVLVDTRAAKRFGVGPGGMILIRDITDLGPGDWAALHCDPRNDPVGPLIRLRVVGVKAATQPYPIGTVTLTRAFDRAYGLVSRYSDFSIPVKLRQGAADIPALGAATGMNVLPEAADAAKIQRSVDHQAQALWLAAGFGALLALLLLSPALLRLATLAAAAHPTLRALGMTRRELLMADVARAAAIGAVAASLAVALALAFSPLMPIGLARDLEPAPGLSFDPFVLGLGGAGVFLAVALAGAFTTSQARTAPADVRAARSCGPADALARWGLPPTAVSGVRLALTRVRGTTAVPIGGTLLGAIASVTVVTVTLTFTASMDHLLSTPRLYGQNWDYRTNYGVPPAAQLRADRSIEDAAAGAEANVRLDGEAVRVVAMDDIKGRIGPVILEGRAPEQIDEIVLASKTLQALGAHVGDSVAARDDPPAGRSRGRPRRSMRMRIVGRGVLPESVANTPRPEAAMTFQAYKRLNPSAVVYAFEARIAPGADRQATLARLERQYAHPAPGPPQTVADFGGVRSLPVVVSALLAAIAAATLAHTLVTAIRRRRRQLAVLKTLGFDRRQLLATVAWQATTFAAIGLAFGVPLGVAAGRWAWYLFAEQIEVVPEPVTPIPLVLLVIPAAVLLANVVAALPAWSAAQTRAAIALRAE
jgi:putative ABC transport system permease protein